MSSNGSSFDIVNDLGPAEPGKFDFTPLFEDVFLSSIPSIILLLILPLRIWMLKDQPRKVTRSFLHSNKLLFLGVFTIMQTVLLIMHVSTSALRTRATIAAAALMLADALSLCALSHVEHLRSIRPSAIINVWLLLTIPFDIARARTLWFDRASNPIAAVFTSTLGIKIMIIIAEAVEKRHILLDRYRHSSPEFTSGIYSRSFFWWLNKLMTTGFQRVIRNEDLYPIGENMKSEYLYSRAQKCWNNSDQTHVRALFWSTLRAAPGALAFGILPRFCLIGFKYAQPFLLSRTVDFANNTDQPESIGWGLTGAFGFVFLGLAVSNGAYYHMVYRFNTIVRGSLVTLIYSKTVDLSITALDESVAVTLMANDTDAICQALINIHEVWATPIELGIALYLLNQQLGLAFLAPCSIAFICTAGILVMAKWMGNAQKLWMRGIQTRVDVTTSILGSMKTVKMLGFTDRITSMIQALRVAEVRLSTLFRQLIIGRVLLANSTEIVSPLATFIVFVIQAKYTGRTLTTSTAYTAMSLIALLAEPVEILLRTIPNLNAAMACFERIQTFLQSESRKDHRLPLLGPTESTQNPHFKNRLTQNIELQNLTYQSPTSLSAMIIAQNASFAWDSRCSAVVNDINLTLPRGQICFVIGPVGCGKSTLLKGLLGETPSPQGFIYTKCTTTGYVEQIPWIQNGTIQENILGVSMFDSPWYDQVIRACALEHDISILPDRSATRVGSGGISLSGGQKQRLALARAIYAKTELIMLDDVFSGLDAETEDQIFKRLFGRQGSGLIREMGTTVLLVTHAVHRLAYADNIVALDSSGHISEQGTFEDLRKSGGYVQGLAMRHKEEEEEVIGEENVGDEHITTDDQDPKLNHFVAMGGAVEALNTSDEVENLNRQTGDLSDYKYYFASIGWIPTVLLFLFVVIYGCASKLPEFALTYWTKAVAAKGNEANAYWLGIYGMLCGISLLGFVAGCCQLLLYMVPKSAEVLHERLLQTVMGAPLSFFTSTDTGVTTNRFSQDMSIVDVDLPYELIDLMSNAIVAIMGAILMSLSAGYFAATIPIIAITVWIIQKFYLRTSRQIRLLDLEAKSPLYTNFIETLSGLSTIRAFNWTDSFHAKNLSLLDTSQKPYYLLFCIQRWLGLVLDLLVTALAIILMILIVKLRADISPGYVGLALLNVMTFNQSLAQVIKHWTSVETAVGAISRLKTFAAKTACENLPEECKSVPDEWPEFGKVEIRNLTASYTSNSNAAIHNLNLNIKAGEKIGMCGRSGSGKSSLIASLLRMLELDRQSMILIDGIDISTLPRQLVRERINCIPQEAFFLRGTIRINADPYSLHSDDQIIDVLERVGLWKLVCEKGGLGVDVDGEVFSAGQKQLFCLARAVLRGMGMGMGENGNGNGRGKTGGLLILDEVTSSVDLETDRLMQRVLRESFDGWTIIAVAHRLDTILDFDRVVVMGGGRILEEGTVDDLLGRADGAFRELYYS